MATKDLKLLQSSDSVYWANFNDIIVSNGDITLLEGTDRIRQDLVKFMLIQIGTLPLFSNYGTIIPFLINNRASSNLFDDLKNEIIYSCKYIQQIYKSTNEAINIQTIVDIKMSSPTPRELDININLLLTDGTTLHIDQTVDL